jgi:hypothetical protein
VEITVRLNLWSPTHKESVLATDPSLVERTLREVADEWSADLFLVKDAADVDEALEWMAISASHGRFLVTAAAGEDDYYDLVGDPTATGEAEDFAFGGQEAGWPWWKIVGADDAVAAALHYLETGELLTDRVWERQK